MYDDACYVAGGGDGAADDGYTCDHGGGYDAYAGIRSTYDSSVLVVIMLWCLV